MPDQITATLLGSINNGLTLAYNSQLYAAPGIYKKFSLDGKSTGAAEVYPRLDMLSGLREWIGPREVQSLSQRSFTITNRTFEQTIAIKRTDMEDDKYGMYSVVAAEMGQNAGRFPDLLMAQLLAMGTTTLWDGASYFFDPSSHVNYTNAGVQTTAANYVAGAYPIWYLMDTTRVLKPTIFQERVPFTLTARFNPDDPAVFDNDEFQWGTRGRCNAGFGLWQLIYASTQEMTAQNLLAARTAMASLRRPDGAPMGILPNKLMTGSSLIGRANAYYKSPLIANDPLTPTVLIENDVVGMFEPIENVWLN
jgi:phage major head subunit gpT-like protein